MSAHRLTTRILSGLLVVIGVAMVVSTLTLGGGPLAKGLIFGLLFMAAGAGRFYLSRRF
jgi:hypothetical protein